VSHSRHLWKVQWRVR